MNEGGGGLAEIDGKGAPDGVVEVIAIQNGARVDGVEGVQAGLAAVDAGDGDGAVHGGDRRRGEGEELIVEPQNAGPIRGGRFGGQAMGGGDAGFDVIDPKAFTQGLVFLNGDLLESTGLNGQSTLRKVGLKTGKVLKQVNVAPEYFAEGLAVLGGKAFNSLGRAGRASRMTWKHFIWTGSFATKVKVGNYYRWAVASSQRRVGHDPLCRSDQLWSE